MKSKKGFEASSKFLLGLVLMLIVLVVMILLKGQIFGATNAAHDICKQSVYQNYLLSLAVNTFGESVKCPTQYVKIDNSNERQAKADLAESMRDCWDQFGEGKIELFNGDGTFCAVCDQVTFTNKNKKITGFVDYLAATRVPLSSNTYAEYLTSYQTKGAAEILDEARQNPEFQQNVGQDVIDPAVQDKYATVFIYVKGRDNIEQFAKKAISVELAAIGTEVITIGIIKAAGAGAAAAIGIATAPISVPVVIIAGGVVLVAGGVLALNYWGAPTEWTSAIQFLPYDENMLTSLGCQILPGQEKPKVGE